MENLLLAGVVLAVLFASYGLTGFFLRYATAQQMVDVPNERSSHDTATPRGGGLAVVLTIVVAFPLLALAGRLAWPLVTGLVGSGALVAGVGFIDDRGHVAARWRLLAHFAAAAWVLYWVGSLPDLPLFGYTLHAGWLGHILAALLVVWLLNLTNFMDGIDGIAAVETITVCVGGALLYLSASSPGAQWLAPVVLAAAVLGFLLWNWPPAKIFMGDAGSGFLGLMLAAFSLQSANRSPALFWGWMVLLGVFVVDATVTLLRRLVRGEKAYEAHRSHAYQHAAQRVGSHLPVTLTVAAINICWLLPIALLVARGVVDGAAGVAVAYLPLLLIAIRLGAGTQKGP